MAKGRNVAEVEALIPEVKDVFERHASLLKEGRVSIEDLVFTKQVSKNYNQYQDRNTLERNSIIELANEGKMLKAGQVLSYVIIRQYTSGSYRMLMCRI
jgi:DNA polymerase elongation subunit (family B)